jgi:hypothetical protein
VQLPYVGTFCFADVNFPTSPYRLGGREHMQQFDVDYFYTLGRAMAGLDECFNTGGPCVLDNRDLNTINTALGWLKPIASKSLETVPGTALLAKEIVGLIEPLLAPTASPTLTVTRHAEIKFSVDAFHNVLRSGAQQIYAFLVLGKGAYSASALIADAASHLSPLAQQVLSKEEKQDFILAGACYACAFPTAAGFHAMRAVEAEARRYHKEVTGCVSIVDWTLDRLINGNSGQKQVGLRDQWKTEGARDDSSLHLIMALLISINQIYRNPIMHPEMILDDPKAKKVFDTAALVVSIMVEDRVQRAATRQPPTP